MEITSKILTKNDKIGFLTFPLFLTPYNAS